MSLRTLLFIFFTGAVITLVGFFGVSAQTSWQWFGSFLPATLDVQGATLSTQTVLYVYGVLLLALNILVFLFLYLILSRLFVRPVESITNALSVFAKSRTLTPVQHLSNLKEIQSFAKAFVEFTDGVEEVHVRDMEISRVKSDFISTAAHQLRTPLTGIRWSLEALAKETLTEPQQALVQNAVGKSRDLVAIVGTLLDISSIESGKHKYTFTNVDFNELTTSVVNDFRPQADQSQVALVLTSSEVLAPPIRADREQIKWVLNNLIENAIRYTPAGGNVTVSLAILPERLQVLVRDTGIGIASKDQSNIFERFYRAENAIAKDNKGNGLGLYIARTIATDHGGDLNFASNVEGPGTTFTLSLPLATA